MSKSAVMVFSRNFVEGGWKWGEHKLPKVSSYTYLGVDFACNGAWNVHLKRVLDNGDIKISSITLPQVFLCLPLRGFTFHS